VNEHDILATLTHESMDDSPPGADGLMDVDDLPLILLSDVSRSLHDLYAQNRVRHDSGLLPG
jgi:hypothetical protein